MKTVCELDKCAGCMACVDKCPKNAINISDSVWKYNAVIDEEKCIECDACHKVCQFNETPIQLKPIVWKQGWAEDEEIRSTSSSGGVATGIELAFIERGGIVCSCVFRNGEFLFDFIDAKQGLEKSKGSKYVKSNPVGIYKKIKNLITTGNKVLFLGLPCQVAAVKNFIGESDNLYTVDLICHGTPSPKVLEMFLNENGRNLKSIEKIKFRTKERFGLECDQKIFSVPSVTDSYTYTFLESVTYTENCYQCQYARVERTSDVTLGDSWGSELPDGEKKRGISLVMIQTEKGKKIVEKARLNLVDVNVEKAVQANHQLQHAALKNKQREVFLNNIHYGYEQATKRCYPKKYIKNVIKTVLYKFQRKR